MFPGDEENAANKPQDGTLDKLAAAVQARKEIDGHDGLTMVPATEVRVMTLISYLDKYFPLPVVNERVVLARNRFYSNMHFNPEFVDTLGDKINKLDEMSAAEVEAFIDTTYKIVLSKEPASSAQTGWMKFKRIPIPQVWNKWVAMQIRNEYDAANGVASPERGSPYSRPSGNRSSGYGSPSGNRR